MRFSPVPAAIRATALAGFAVAGLALAAPAQAAPTMPVTAGVFAGDANLVTDVGWDHHPRGHAYGHRRHYGWRGPGWRGPGWRGPGWRGPGWRGPAFAYGYGRPGYYGQRAQTCQTTYVRQWNEWRGGWIMQPVRQCW